VFPVIIKSLSGFVELQFSEPEGLRQRAGKEYYRVTIRGHDLLASLKVYAFEPHVGLAEFFEELALHWRGWKGEKKWSSLEGELSLICTSDGFGHVAIEVVLNSRAGGGWSVRGTLHAEAGQLEQIASDVKKFFMG
jgi:hypothetical protein